MLLVLVVAVWGTVIYKVISGLSPDLPESNTQQVLALKSFKIDTKIDTFSVKLVNRDPFLGTVTIKKKPSTNTKKRKTITWQPIEYLGIIENDNLNEKIFIVSISGRQSLLKRGQKRDSITLLSGNKKTITLRYKGQSKIITRKVKG